jgi:hypothetical protein
MREGTRLQGQPPKTPNSNAQKCRILACPTIVWSSRVRWAITTIFCDDYFHVFNELHQQDSIMLWQRQAQQNELIQANID